MAIPVSWPTGILSRGGVLDLPALFQSREEVFRQIDVRLDDPLLAGPGDRVGMNLFHPKISHQWQSLMSCRMFSTFSKFQRVFTKRSILVLGSAKGARERNLFSSS